MKKTICDVCGKDATHFAQIIFDASSQNIDLCDLHFAAAQTAVATFLKAT